LRVGGIEEKEEEDVKLNMWVAGKNFDFLLTSATSMRSEDEYRA